MSSNQHPVSQAHTNYEWAGLNSSQSDGLIQWRAPFIHRSLLDLGVWSAVCDFSLCGKLKTKTSKQNPSLRESAADLEVKCPSPSLRGHRAGSLLSQGAASESWKPGKQKPPLPQEDTQDSARPCWETSHSQPASSADTGHQGPDIGPSPHSLSELPLLKMALAQQHDKEIILPHA